MVVFNFWSAGSSSSTEVDKKETAVNSRSSTDHLAPPLTEIKPDALPPSTKDNLLPNSPPSFQSSATNGSTDDHLPESHQTKVRPFSFRSFGILYGGATHEEHKPVLSLEKAHEKRIHASMALSKRLAQRVLPNADKRAQESALIVRQLIIGPSSINPSSVKPTRAVSKPQLSRVKSQLMQPVSANKVIAQLRALPVSETLNHIDSTHADVPGEHEERPIHAVCLEFPEAEANDRHFARLKKDDEVAVQAATFFTVPSVATAGIAALSAMFEDMHLISLVSQPDLGLGQPGDGEGLLAGALPTAETVINGIEQITPQLMALGFATGRAVLPDHTGIYPPTDRISVLTYWWGLELALPPPTLAYLANAQSISSTVMNFLTALSVINNGVREILPFIRYIAQFVDFEFSAIRKQNKGKGVVCAATWIMPAAMVPRPWDFPTPPIVSVPDTPTTPKDPNDSTPPPDQKSDAHPLPPGPVFSSTPVLPAIIVTAAKDEPSSPPTPADSTSE